MVWITGLRPTIVSIGLDFPNLWVAPGSIIGQVQKMGLGLLQVQLLPLVEFPPQFLPRVPARLEVDYILV